MASYLIKTFRGGIAEFEDKGLPGACKFNKNMDIRKREDTLSCGQALEAIGAGVFVDMPNFFVNGSDGNTYAFGDGGNIYKITSAMVVTKVYTDSDGEITGAYEWGLSSGKSYLFWTTSTKLHCKELPGNTGWSDVDALATFPKTTLTAATWHTMCMTVGSLQICNSQYLAMVGYDGSFTNNSLDCMPGNVTKTLIERGGYAVIGLGKKDSSENAGLLAWDTTSLNWNDYKKIPAKGINAVLDTTIPIAQVGINGGLYYADLGAVQPIIEIPDGGYCNPGGAINDGLLGLFGIYGNSAGNNGIYSYGKKKRNQYETLNLEYAMTSTEIGATVTEIGALCKMGSDILVSYRTASTYGVKKVSTTAKAVCQYDSIDLYAPASNFPVIPTWTQVVVETKPLPASTKIELYYRMDKVSAWIKAKLEERDINGAYLDNFATTNGTEAVFLMGDKGRVCEIRVVATPTANTTPNVLRIQPFFE
jgi:hypothetical protein